MFARNVARSVISWMLRAIRRSAEGRGMLTRVYSDKKIFMPVVITLFKFWKGE